MLVVVSSMAHVTDPTKEIVRACRDLRIPNPQRAQAMRFGSMYSASKHPKWVSGCVVLDEGREIYIPRAAFMDQMFDAGLCEGHQVEVATSVHHVEFPPPLITPYEHQKEALESFLAHYREDQQLLRPTDATIVMATSAGKTVLGMLIASSLKQRTLVVVHSHEVEKAWCKDACKVFGISKEKIGRIRGKTLRIGEHFTVGSVQTLMNLEPSSWRGKFGLVLFDELHRHAANKFSNVAQRAAANVRVGITATDTRKDGRMPCIRWHLGLNVFHDTTPRNSVPLCYHGVKSTQTFPPHSYDGSTPEWDYTKLVADMSNSQERLERIAALVKFVIKNYRGDVLLVSNRVAMCDSLCAMLVAQGISACSLTGRITGKAREQLYDEVCDSQYRVTCAMLPIVSDGANNPYWFHVINTVPFSDPKTTEQLKGRPIRKMKDKQEGHFWDIVDNVQMLRNMGNSRYRAVRKHIHREQWHTIVSTDPNEITTEGA